MFSRPKILFLVFLLFVALLNSIPTYLLNLFINHYSTYIALISKQIALDHGSVLHGLLAYIFDVDGCIFNLHSYIPVQLANGYYY